MLPAARPAPWAEHLWPAAQEPFTEWGSVPCATAGIRRQRRRWPRARRPSEPCRVLRPASDPRAFHPPPRTWPARLIAGESMVRHDGESATRTEAPGGTLTHAVLLAQPHDVPVVVAPDLTEGEQRVGHEHPVRRQDLRAASTTMRSGAGRLTTVVVKAARSAGLRCTLRELAAVVEDIGAGSTLGHSRALDRKPERARRADGDDGGGRLGGASAVSTAARHASRVIRSFSSVSRPCV